MPPRAKKCSRKCSSPAARRWEPAGRIASVGSSGCGCCFARCEGASETQLRGTVYAVELSNNGPSEEATLDATSHAIVLRRVREARIQQLLSPETSPPPPGDDGAGEPDSPIEDLAPPGAPPAASAPVPGPEDAAEAAPDGPAAPPPPGPFPVAQEPDSGHQGVRFPVGERLGGNARNPLYLHPSNTRLTQLNIGIVGDLGTGKTQLIKSPDLPDDAECRAEPQSRPQSS